MYLIYFLRIDNKLGITFSAPVDLFVTYYIPDDLPIADTKLPALCQFTHLLVKNRG